MKKTLIKILALMLAVVVVATPVATMAEEATGSSSASDTNKDSTGTDNNETDKDDANTGKGDADKEETGSDKDNTETDNDNATGGTDAGSKDDGKDENKDDKNDTSDKDSKVLKDISYEGEVGEFIEFSGNDFDNACKAATGSAMKYVKISKLPSSTYGVLYYDYEGDDETKVKTSNKIYKSDFNDIGLLAKKEGTVKIDFEVWYTNNDKTTGTIVIEIEAGAKKAETISYSVKQGKSVSFDGEDFNDVCDDLSGKDLSYVKLTLPSSSKGTLYYDYDGRDEEKVSASKKYYYDDDPDISDISFVPKSSATGTVSISYKAYNTKGNTYNGTIKIKITASSTSSKDDEDEDAEDISYTVYNDDTLDFDIDDFDEVCDDATGDSIYKVVFSTIPSASSGTLYLGYRSSGKYDDKVKKSTSYYPDDDPEISDITFVPKANYTGTVSITYKGYYTSSKYYTGKIKIKVKSGGNNKNFFEDDNAPSVTLNAKTSAVPTVPATSIAAACKSVTGESLEYISFTLPSETVATLWYDYDSDGKTKVNAGTKYYLTKKPYIKNISILPKAGFEGMVTIFYSGEDTDGNEVSGDLSIIFENDIKFSDVPESTWYYTSISTVCAAGLMKGNADGTFNPEGGMSLAEAITMAARLYSLHVGDKKNFVPTGESWYQVYVDYAVEKRIIGRYDFEDYTRYATRGEMAYIFCNSLDSKELEKINSVKVPDVDENEMYGKEIYILYNAGVLTGNDTAGTFMKDSTIKRAEAATILGRMDNIIARVKK